MPESEPPKRYRVWRTGLEFGSVGLIGCLTFSVLIAVVVVVVVVLITAL